LLHKHFLAFPPFSRAAIDGKEKKNVFHKKLNFNDGNDEAESSKMLSAGESQHA
jgi:hypothetical protein